MCIHITGSATLHDIIDSRNCGLISQPPPNSCGRATYHYLQLFLDDVRHSAQCLPKLVPRIDG